MSNAAAADLVTEYTVKARRSLTHRQRRFVLHLTPWFGGRRLVDISTTEVHAFTAARLKAKAAPGEINRELAALKRLFRLAKQAGRFVGDVRIFRCSRSTTCGAGFSSDRSSTPSGGI